MTNAFEPVSRIGLIGQGCSVQRAWSDRYGPAREMHGPANGSVVRRNVAEELRRTSRVPRRFLDALCLELFQTVLHGMGAVGQPAVVGDLDVQARACIQLRISGPLS